MPAPAELLALFDPTIGGKRSLRGLSWGGPPLPIEKCHSQRAQIRERPWRWIAVPGEHPREVRRGLLPIRRKRVECACTLIVRKTMEHATLVYLALALVAYPFLFMLYEIWRHGGAGQTVPYMPGPCSKVWTRMRFLLHRMLQGFLGLGA